MFDQIFQQLQPMIVTGVVAILGGAILFISKYLVGLLHLQNKEKEDKLVILTRDFLHSVVWNALNYAAAKADSTLLNQLAHDQPPPKPIIDMAKEYIKQLNPDLLNKTGLAEDQLEKVIASKLPELIALVKSKG